LLPYDSAQLQGWGAALVLILIILAINIGVRTLVLNKNDTYRFGKMIKDKIGGTK
jgi:phosphate transport system permease protein